MLPERQQKTGCMRESRTSTRIGIAVNTSAGVDYGRRVPSVGVWRRSDRAWWSEAEVGSLAANPLKFKFARAPHLRVAAESWPPHVQVEEVEAEGGQKVTRAAGPMANFLDVLAKSLNFTYTVVLGDGYWGAPDANGTWNGMIGMLLREKADFGLGPFGMTHARSAVVDFTMPIFREVLHILVSRPRPEPDPWGFLAPLAWHVWVALALSCLMVTAVAVAVVGTLGFGGPSSVQQHLWACYGIFLSQTLTWVPTGLSLRVTIWLWLTAVLVVMRSYSGALTSLLAVRTVPIKYDSLDDVLRDSSIKLLLEGSTALTGHLQTAKEGVYGQLADAVRTRGRTIRASRMQEEAYAHIPDGRHAMFLEAVGCNKVYSDHFSRTGQCDFYMSRGVFWPLFYALVVPKDSPLRELIDARILALREFGIYERWALDQVANRTHCLKLPTKLKLQEPYNLIGLWATADFTRASTRQSLDPNPSFRVVLSSARQHLGVRSTGAYDALFTTLVTLSGGVSGPALVAIISPAISFSPRCTHTSDSTRTSPPVPFLPTRPAPPLPRVHSAIGKAHQDDAASDAHSFSSPSQVA
ncbi:olfactory ionotropic receptor IR4 [Penaeus vannamei]|uniref:Olfactory ionotropic receptor IR4 n=1 Tax=Penaeus vannamei TaxID=6689 RepID=A0A423TS27_PENVA|nr:olfactory ionotropic receptor IR4 [Penaeus vannamei]